MLAGEGRTEGCGAAGPVEGEEERGRTGGRRNGDGRTDGVRGVTARASPGEGGAHAGVPPVRAER
ncbi:hypothetical protein GCM10010272_28280 [Streptomyces lateritius]|nr:hypothetical protein GCM10010272_28280 [Streptomyces lateritius]